MSIERRKAFLNSIEEGEGVDYIASWIDDVETAVNNIAALLDIDGVGDLGDIETALEEAKELGNILY
jgi:hypothetical protein